MNAPLARGLGFLLLWLAVAGPRPSDLPVGVAVAAAAAWTSLILAPPAGARLNLSAALSFLIEFLSGSLSAGLDVAGARLRARPTSSPACSKFGSRFAPGFARNAFCIIANLMPGTLLTGFDPDDAQGLGARPRRSPADRRRSRGRGGRFLRTLGR